MGKFKVGQKWEVPSRPLDWFIVKSIRDSRIIIDQNSVDPDEPGIKENEWEISVLESCSGSYELNTCWSVIQILAQYGY